MTVSKAECTGIEGTIVSLPPAAQITTATTAQSSNSAALIATEVVNVTATIERRRAKMEARKLELLIEARNARIQWIRDEDQTAQIGTSVDTISLNVLQACHQQILPCAPQIIHSLLFPNYYMNTVCADSTEQRMLEQILEKQHLSLKDVVSTDSALIKNNDEGREAHLSKEDAIEDGNNILSVPPHHESYSAFLDALCNPSAADIVMSIQKFCSTMHEAATVMTNTMKGEDETLAGQMQSNEISSSNEVNNAAAAFTSTDTEDVPTQDSNNNYGVSLARAIRGFIHKTMREMHEHEAFETLVQSKEGKSNKQNSINFSGEDGSIELLASLEKFVYGKCRSDIDMLILQLPEKSLDSNCLTKVIASVKTVGELESELQEKMLSLQFVSPAHLEIHCLKSKTSGIYRDIDLSHVIERIRSIPSKKSSPRQMLHMILLAHHGVLRALRETCADEPPPGADDALPCLILATLRAHALHLPSALRIIEIFAPLSLLRGEVGYAYTSLCGAMQFIKDLDVDGHLKEVVVLEGSEENSAVLSIGPDEFRIGLEECRKNIMTHKLGGDIQISTNVAFDEVVTEKSMGFDDECMSSIDEKYSSITARQVRKARQKGELVDLNWALKEQQIDMYRKGKIEDMPTRLTNSAADTVPLLAGREYLLHNLPPEEPPLSSQFARSYSFLTAHPDSISVRDLPLLLKEYKMLVHVTEVLFNERSMWRESERKRLLQFTKENLEQDLADAKEDVARNSA